MRGSGARWPLRHTLQLVLVMCVLQPTLLALSVVDFAWVWRDAPSLPLAARVLMFVSRILRPGALARVDSGRSGAVAWELALALYGVLITQAWYCMRIGSWWSVTEGYARSETRTQLRMRKHTIKQQLEVCARVHVV